MESLSKIEIRILFICFLFLMCSTIKIRAQQIYNCNEGTILDIRYENLYRINQLSAVELSNLKYCILRIRNNISPIDLVSLNSLINLELLHVIIETDYQSVFSVLNVNNSNLFITYQISVPQ